MARKPVAKKTTGRPAKAAKAAETQPQAVDGGEPELVTALRDAIRSSGMTINAVAVLAGVTATNVHRFMAGKGMTVETAGRIATVLGYGLTKLRTAKMQD